ncbi:hypothetical protein SAMN05216327_106378 [Dyadobacter sp. SG02]|uniref:hypothetical protein n=1 Tax=Dyadobacter sp. SG02 TaxID=1855291 RepID=UPI0008B1D422|nr:hypothetical protein [Dyadobacter sp. SG02]SEJ15584.1 hypothetical protein SAMN05216327_106378 [Dyadobacter sp. SG02]
MNLSSITLLILAFATVCTLVAAVGFYRSYARFENAPDKVRPYLILALCSVLLIGAAAYLRSTEANTETALNSSEVDPASLEVSLPDLVKDRYVGEWKAPRGKAGIEIYEENGGVFAKFWQGDIIPLKFQPDGQYYGRHHSARSDAADHSR